VLARPARLPRVAPVARLARLAQMALATRLASTGWRRPVVPVSWARHCECLRLGDRDEEERVGSKRRGLREAAIGAVGAMSLPGSSEVGPEGWSMSAAIRQPGIRQPGIRQPGIRQPGIRQPGIRQPGIRQPGIRQPRGYLSSTPYEWQPAPRVAKWRRSSASMSSASMSSESMSSPSMRTSGQ